MGFQDFKKKLILNAKKTYKKFDIYGKHLTLTFEGEDTHYTFIGATFTISIMVFMLIYACYQLQTMVKKQRTTVNIKTTYDDLTKNYQNISIGEYGFDFALQMGRFNVPVYDETYFRFVAENVVSWWAPDENGIITRYKTSWDLNITKCDYYNAPKSEIERLGIDQTFY